jgi:uncharacterized protein (UPF0212 family)
VRGDFLKEETRREIDKNDLGIYFCPECGEPFDNISTTESHLRNVYELHLKAWHGKLR